MQMQCCCSGIAALLIRDMHICSAIEKGQVPAALWKHCESAVEAHAARQLVEAQKQLCSRAHCNSTSTLL